MNTSSGNNSLKDFVDSVCDKSHLRVETDLGDGFFRLRASEAQRRQAAQDVRCSEDIVVELLRNSKDADAKNIFVATNKEGNTRHLIIIDDGKGIPDGYHDFVFEPYVTSKLDTMTFDRWGVHGRGMALYSTKVNSEEARIIRSKTDAGAAIYIKTNTKKLPEKTDQSTFPNFYINSESTLVARGPKNIIRTICEFAVENRDTVNVYYGSPSEISATLYKFNSDESNLDYVFSTPNFKTKPTEILKYASDPEELVNFSSEIGLIISSRTARRIMDGEIKPVRSALEHIATKGIKHLSEKNITDNLTHSNRVVSKNKTLDLLNIKELKLTEPKKHKVSFSDDDLESLRKSVNSSFKDIAYKYYLDENIDPKVNIRGDKVTISFSYSQKGY